MGFVVFQSELGLVIVETRRQERFVVPWGLEVVNRILNYSYHILVSPKD